MQRNQKQSFYWKKKKNRKEENQKKDRRGTLRSLANRFWFWKRSFNLHKSKVLARVLASHEEAN